MKLFITNRQFQGEMEKALAPLKRENEELKSKIANKEYKYLEESNKLIIQIEKYEDIIKNQEEFMHKLNIKILELKEDKKQFFGAKGGLTKQNNKLREELKKVKEELEEANKKLSQRYIVKELEPVKAKNTQVMKTKSGARTSRIIKKVVENEKK